MTRGAGMRLAPAASARSLGGYNDFVLGMPASLAAALADHARCLRNGWGIGREPLQWQSPEDWGTVHCLAPDRGGPGHLPRPPAPGAAPAPAGPAPPRIP